MKLAVVSRCLEMDAVVGACIWGGLAQPGFGGEMQVEGSPRLTSGQWARDGPPGGGVRGGGPAPGSPAALPDAVAARPRPAPGRTLVNTHARPGQTGANETQGTAGAANIAHENPHLRLTTDVNWPSNGQRFKR